MSKSKKLGVIKSIAILVIICLNVVLAVTQERGAERALEALSNLNSPTCLVLRDGAHPVLPNGDTVIEEGDLLVMAAPTFEERAEVTLREVTVTPHGRLAGQRLRDVPQGKHPFIVVMLKPDGQTNIPDGNTLIYAGDEAVIATLAS